MGYVKDRIKELSKTAGSKKRARKNAESWFKESSASRKIVEVKSTRDRFQSGKIYVFDYSPTTKDLPWYDKNPVVLALEGVNDNDLGVNLNLLPISVKEQLLDDLYTRMGGSIKSAYNKSYDAERQRALRITYDGMKSYLESNGCVFAIRRYNPSRKKRQSVVSYLRWPDIALCDFISLNGTTITQIRQMFSKQ
jgi:hypothetical protein|tara:strand:- start:3172 stop:3753 length:582 start_codon:yes stop_codon:yes gene_type:complete